jgi:hypothetical protein
MKKGEIIANIGGQSRTFKFGTNSTSIFTSVRNCKLSDFQKEFESDPIGSMRDMLFAGLKCRESVNNLPDNFDRWIVGDWIDELEDQATLNKIADVMREGIEVMVGNLTGPQKAGPIRKK